MQTARERSPLTGRKIKIKPLANQLGGEEILIEDWWENLYGKSWMVSNGNPAAMNYAFRSGSSRDIHIPIDNEVLYGKIDMLGYLVHISELELEEGDLNG